MTKPLTIIGKQEENISKRIEYLVKRLASLEDKVRVLEGSEDFSTGVEKVPVKISKRRSKKEILRLFEQKGELDYVEIMEALGIDLKLVVEICSELEKESKIEVIK